jgi:hypothetical protein
MERYKELFVENGNLGAYPSDNNALTLFAVNY